MIRMNPIVTSVIPLATSASTAFYKSVPKAYQPASSRTSPVPVFEVVEDMSVETPDTKAAGNWRGGWAQRFIPEQIKYQTAVEALEDGMRSLTHAAMGVSSMTLWTVKENPDGSIVVDKEGGVTSSRMLMGFISSSLKESHEKLAEDFVKALEKHVASLTASSQSLGASSA